LNWNESDIPSDRSEIAYLYTLADPVTGDVRYVGQCGDVTTRFAGHMHEARSGSGNPAKSKWIGSLLANGMKPIMTIIAIAPLVDALRIEKTIIRKMRAEGYDLVNHSYNFDPVVCPHCGGLLDG
jgi:hypothetical protein